MVKKFYPRLWALALQATAGAVVNVAGVAAAWLAFDGADFNILAQRQTGSPVYGYVAAAILALTPALAGLAVCRVGNARAGLPNSCVPAVVGSYLGVVLGMAVASIDEIPSDVLQVGMALVIPPLVSTLFWVGFNKAPTDASS